MILNDRFDVDAELAIARIRIARAIDRCIHFAARSKAQRIRQQRARAKRERSKA